MNIKIHCIILIVMMSVRVQSQQHVGQWKSFTDMKPVRSAVGIDGTIWAATGGGVFAYDTSAGTFLKYTNTEGLDTNDVYAIAYDGSNRIWTGGAGGWVNIYDINLRRWQTIEDIAVKTENAYRKIQSFHFKGDTVFLVTEFGVSVFKCARWEFGDTYSNLGSLISPRITCMTLQQDRIWIGTNIGIATALFSSPYAWTSYASSSGLPSTNITALTVFHDTVIVGTNNGAAFYAGGSFIPLGSFSGKNISDFKISDGTLLVLSSSSSAYTVEALNSVLGSPLVVASNSENQGSCIVPGSSLWIATAKGLAHETPSGWQYIYPNGPNSNSFSSIVVDENGILWAASGEGSSGKGFYRYNPNLSNKIQWKNFTSDLYPLMRKDGALLDAYHQVSLGAQGTVWVSSWGDGMVRVAGDTIQRKYNSSSTPSLPGARIDLPNFPVGGGVAVDLDGREWAVHRNEQGNKSLLRYDSETTGTFFNTQAGSSSGLFHGILVDQNNTKWMISTVPWHMDISTGLYLFNEKRIVPGTQSTGGWGCITNLSSSIVLSLALGLEGELWAGLGVGVAIIPDPLYPSARTISFPLREQVVQAIAVDAVNHKWVGTKAGVFVMNADGTEILNLYNVQTSRKALVSNDIRSIAIDQKRGIIYFGTEQGLSSLAIEPVAAKKIFSQLDVGPNPFILPGEQPLTIRNLMASSSVKIMTVSGQVIREFEAQGGGRAFWDGRDKDGLLVASGVYFIVAFVENGSETVVGKVAVVRR